MLPEELKQMVYEYAYKIADTVDYIGAGTVEFIVDGAEVSILWR